MLKACGLGASRESRGVLGLLPLPAFPQMLLAQLRGVLYQHFGQPCPYYHLNLVGFFEKYDDTNISAAHSGFGALHACVALYQ